MPSRRRLLGTATCLGAVLISTAVGCGKAQEKKVQKIQFDLGRNIVETARASGVPSFEASDVAGFITYSAVNLPRQIPVRFTRPGFEIEWLPVFAVAMNADRDRNATLPVASVSLSLNSDIASHSEAQAFVEQTIAQFAKGKWKRFHDPVWDVLLTGRSSILDEAGEMNTMQMTIDPSYKIAPEEWPKLAKTGPIWRWVGDGVLASLTVGYTEREASTVPQYSMDLEFELLDNYTRRFAEYGAQKLKEGDAKGWNSTAKNEASKKDKAELNKRLIANAIKRGDRVVQE
jgi:hypothetical protein